MKLIRWSFNNLHVPMMQDDAGELWCTGKQICDVLGITEDNLKKIAKRHEDEFDALRGTVRPPKEFLLENKTELGLKRVRKDMVLWSETDMILIATLSKSQLSKQMRREFVRFIRDSAAKEAIVGYVKKDDYDHMRMELGRMAVRLESLERMLTPGKKVQFAVVR